MFRKLILTTTAAALAVAPISVQAAPARASAPVAGDAENLGGGFIIPLVAFAVLAGLLVLLFNDDDDETPVSA